ncbi:hypothetical protein EG328_002539 [Venturia inaequalis]|uniref:Uncharacterized protein n=1 Tax=Venturia inaequalis TaxID=5025 RepID=A0A8H3UWH9_VENIN|nr:hypothetical protein EG328_002539 [Venturia inaequalis]
MSVGQRAFLQLCHQSLTVEDTFSHEPSPSTSRISEVFLPSILSPPIELLRISGRPPNLRARNLSARTDSEHRIISEEQKALASRHSLA